MCMSGFPAWVCHEHAWCAERWEKNVKSLEVERWRVVKLHMELETELRSFARATSILHPWGIALSKFLRIVKHYFLTNLWSCLFSFVCSGLAKLKNCVHKTNAYFPLQGLDTARSLSISMTKTGKGLVHTKDHTEILLLNLPSLSSGSSNVLHTSEYFSMLGWNSGLLWCGCWAACFRNHQWNLDSFYPLTTATYPICIHNTKITKYIISRYNELKVCKEKEVFSHV